MCGQFNQQLDDGEYAQAGIDINMAVFFILVVCAEGDCAVWNQGLSSSQVSRTVVVPLSLALWNTER